MNNLMVPEHTVHALQLYAQERLQPGGFLTAVLSNDLFLAVDRADYENFQALSAIVVYIYNRLPRAAWGSPERVSTWLEGTSA
jgi:hypothetical protein